MLTAWVDHYRSLGIERFVLGFHFTDYAPADRRLALQTACRELGITPAAISTGPWHEHTNTRLRDLLRVKAGDGWHLLADSDEFQVYPVPMDEVIAQAEQGTGTVGGLMLDRVADDGTLTGWTFGVAGLDATYPLGGFLTHHLMRGDPRKVVLAHSRVPVDSGNHRAEGHRPGNRPPVVVHHFKWRSGVAEDVERRALHSADGTWQTVSPAWLSEARQCMGHLVQHDGRINVDDPRFGFRPVSLRAVPAWWAAEATQLVSAWRPPVYGRAWNESWSMTSSPSPAGGSNRA
ncbi:hypothetical protein [Streptomyces sp. NPDC102490]|uniref:hypothetical protein n=1 Tax=Streptomyces sp. NPDC102490 TaxID=3366183 RepID=UPI003809BA15